MTLRTWQQSLTVIRTLVLASVVVPMLGVPAATRAHEADGHPARIHEGTCDELGPVTDQLTGVGAEIDLDGTPISTPEVVGAARAVPIAVSTTTLEITASDLIDTPHAIIVYASDGAMDTPLVCGNVGGVLMIQMPGMPMPGDQLAIWLVPHGESNYTGLALQESQGEDRTGITIFLAQGRTGGDETMSEATPTSG